MGRVTFTTKGFIEVYWISPDGPVFVSKHRQETEAVESLTAHAASLVGDQSYELRYPNKEVKAYGILNPGDPTVDQTPPTAPSNLASSNVTARSVTLTWTASTDAFGVTGYQIYRDNVPLASSVGTSYVDQDVGPSTTYAYKVAAYDAAGNVSQFSNLVNVTTPANTAPVLNIGAQSLTTGNAYSLDLNLYYVDAEDDPVTFSIIGGTLPTGLTFANDIVSGTPSSVQATTVTFRADDGIFTTDEAVSFTVKNADVTAPPVPTIAVDSTTKTSATLSWTPVVDTTVADAWTSGLAGYKLYRDGSLRTTLAPASSTTDSGLAAGTTYSYTLSAFDAAGNESAQSSAVDATTQLANSPPEFTTNSPLTAATAGVPFTRTITAEDVDGDLIDLTYADSTFPVGVTITVLDQVPGSNSRSLEISGTIETAGDYSISVTADDGQTMDAEADWLYRAGLTKDGNGDLIVDWANAAAAGVVFAHDFRYVDEVNNFRASNAAATIPDAVRVKDARYPDPQGLGAHTVEQGQDYIPGTLGKSLLTWAPGVTDSGYFPAGSWADPRPGSSSSAYVTGPGLAKTEFSQSQLAWAEAIGEGAWNRPLVPFASGTGLPYVDRAARASEAVAGIPLFNWNPNDTFILYSEFINPDQGYWANSKYLTDPVYADDNGLAADNPKRIIGSEFWLQFRVKQSATRNVPRPDVSGGLASRLTTPGKYSQRYEVPVGGKLAFMLDKYSGGLQEVIPFSGDGNIPRWESAVTQQDIDSGDVLLPFRQYTNFGVNMVSPVAAGTSFQPGSPYEQTALLNVDIPRNAAWFMPVGEWVTIMVHVIPGSYQPAYATDYYDWHIEVKAARWGETSWTTIWSAPFNIACDAMRDTYPQPPYRAIPGYNKFALSCYMNSVPNFNRFDQIYSQVILSTQEIPCPQVY